MKLMNGCVIIRTFRQSLPVRGLRPLLRARRALRYARRRSGHRQIVICAARRRRGTYGSRTRVHFPARTRKRSAHNVGSVRTRLSYAVRGGPCGVVCRRGGPCLSHDKIYAPRQIPLPERHVRKKTFLPSTQNGNRRRNRNRGIARSQEKSVNVLPSHTASHR